MQETDINLWKGQKINKQTNEINEINKWINEMQWW